MNKRYRVIVVVSLVIALASSAIFFLYLDDQLSLRRNTNAIEGNLSEASEILSKVIELSSSTDAKEVVVMLEEYSTAIRQAITDVETIQNPNEARDASILVFERVAAHVGSLRMLQVRPPFNDTGAVDKAMSENISVQEKAVETLSRFPISREVGRRNRTLSELSCPGCNVVIITLSTLRKDRLGAYGYAKPTSPNIDRFFQEGLIFSNTMAPTSWTAPNAITLLTSLFPYRHGVMRRDIHPVINTKILTLAQILKNKGYRTAAFTGGGDYDDAFVKLRRGFEVYMDSPQYKNRVSTTPSSVSPIDLNFAPLSVHVSEGIEWLEKHETSKFFLLLQGYDTHCPYYSTGPLSFVFTKGIESDVDFTYCHWTHADTLPQMEGGKPYWLVQVPGKGAGEPMTERKFFQNDIDYMNALYDARVAEMDRTLGQYLGKIKELGLEENTIILLMSDHGEMLGENGRFMRGGSIKGTFYEPTLNFPLMIKHPKLKERILVEDLIQTVDIMPSILSMVGIADPQKELREGKPFALSVFHDAPANAYSFAATKYSPAVTSQYMKSATAVEAVRDKRWKLIKETIFREDSLAVQDTLYQLFDLERDPKETENLHDREPETAKRLNQTLEAWLERYR